MFVFLYLTDMRVPPLKTRKKRGGKIYLLIPLNHHLILLDSGLWRWAWPSAVAKPFAARGRLRPRPHRRVPLAGVRVERGGWCALPCPRFSPARPSASRQQHPILIFRMGLNPFLSLFGSVWISFNFALGAGWFGCCL
jgi:hypothetical protein